MTKPFYHELNRLSSETAGGRTHPQQSKETKVSPAPFKGSVRYLAPVRRWSATITQGGVVISHDMFLARADAVSWAYARTDNVEIEEPSV